MISNDLNMTIFTMNHFFGWLFYQSPDDNAGISSNEVHQAEFGNNLVVKKKKHFGKWVVLKSLTQLTV